VGGRWWPPDCDGPHAAALNALARPYRRPTAAAPGCVPLRARLSERAGAAARLVCRHRRRRTTMSKDENRSIPEPLLIQLEPAWERRNWCRWLGCSEEELEHAVAHVGHD